jgi:hypothetical protein
LVADDPTRDLLLAGLRRLRRTPGGLTRQAVAGEEVLVEYLGEGDADQAHGVLMQLIEDHEDDPEGDIGTFFRTCGWQIEGETLDARLKRYAQRFHVDERTALRRSDRGARKLARLLRDSLVYDRPFARLFLFQSGATVTAWVEVHVERSSHWRRPTVRVNGDVLDLTFRLDREGSTDKFLSSLEKLPALPLDTSSAALEPLLTVQVDWSMPVWPAWDLTTHLADERLFSRMQTDRAGRVELQVSWINEAAANSRDQLLRTGTCL